MFEGSAMIGYDAQKFYLGAALNQKSVQGFVAGCLERMGKEDPEDEALFRNLWEDEGERDTVLQVLQDNCEVLPGRPEDYFPYWPRAKKSVSSVPTKTQRAHPVVELTLSFRTSSRPRSGIGTGCG